MTILREKDLEFDFSPCTAAVRFDDPKTHRLPHCMKSVDFIIELPQFIAFVEVKDPDINGASPADVQKFAARYQSGELQKSLVTKFRDTWLYRWASDVHHPGKYLKYIVLLQMKSLNPPQLTALQDALKRSLPVGTPAGWNRELAEDVVVLDVSAWNKLGVFGTVVRK
jgi:hypothetical protein